MPRHVVNVLKVETEEALAETSSATDAPALACARRRLAWSGQHACSEQHGNCGRAAAGVWASRFGRRRGGKACEGMVSWRAGRRTGERLTIHATVAGTKQHCCFLSSMQGFTHVVMMSESTAAAPVRLHLTTWPRGWILS